MSTLVAISSAYGARGSVIGPRVAEELGVPFVDRAIPLGVAERLDLPVEAADADEGRERASFLERVLASFASAEPMSGPLPLAMATAHAEDFHHATEEVLRRQAATGAGVILGRGSVFALRADPRVLRVRLGGPEAARVRQAMELFGIDESAARGACRTADRTHSDYARRFYGEDITDSALYHLGIDSTALPAEACVQLVVTAARAHAAAGPATGPA